jgi:hypothetical protein
LKTIDREDIKRYLIDIAELLIDEGMEIKTIADFGMMRRIPDKALIDVVEGLLKELSPGSAPGHFNGSFTYHKEQIKEWIESARK